MASPKAMFLQIPPEVTEHALTFLPPRDVANFSQTCQLAHCLVYGAPDQYLWRQLFLGHPFDDPRKSLDYVDSYVSYNWRGELQRRIRAELVAYNAKKRPGEQSFSLETFISTILDASPVQAGVEQGQSDSLQWVTRILCETRILEATFKSLEANDVQLISRLRALLSLSLDKAGDAKTRERLKTLRTNSRCYVYDLRNYRRDNEYGPFLRNGKTNWIHAEAIVNVVQMNLDNLPGIWVDTRPPVGLEATRAYSVTGALTRAPDDWACVEGTWRRYVCFMDYRDLFAFNYSDHTHGIRDPTFFEDCDFQEATRLIELKLRLVPAASLPSNCDFLQPNKSVKLSRYPNLYFSGTSKGVQGNEATVNGIVSMGDDGVARWRFTLRKASVYDGQSQWSSEGIQLGHPGSAAGIIGSWTGAMHDHGDPVGPFWLWKVPDNFPTRAMDFEF